MKCNRVNIILTHRCNLNCKHCYMNASYSTNEDYDKIFLDTKNLLNKLINNGINEVMFTGGECTTYPYIIELVKYTKEIGFRKVDIFTNGMILNKELLNKVDTCYLSIDGLEHNHNFIRGNPFAFKNLLRTLDYLREIDKITYLQFTANNQNINDLCELSKLLLNYLNVRKVKIVNISNEGRAINSDLQSIDLLKIKEIIPILYENTKFHIQFLSDLWSKYDIENYYLTSTITLPIWFDLVDGYYYVYDKNYFVGDINKFKTSELHNKLLEANSLISKKLKTKIKQQEFINIEEVLTEILKKEK